VDDMRTKAYSVQLIIAVVIRNVILVHLL